MLVGEAIVEEFVGFCGGLISMYVSSPSAELVAAGCLVMMVVHICDDCKAFSGSDTGEG